MTTTLTPEHVAVLLAQGRAWIERTAELEHWLDAREADALALLQACPEPDLAAHVETLRQRMWAAMETHGAIPHFERGHASDRPAEIPRPRRAPRGLARHLYRKG